MGFSFEFLDDFRILMLHGASPPPAARWKDYLLEIRDKDLTALGLLVFTSGGAPNPAQRRELNQVLVGRYFARAIVHESAMVRGVVAAVSWFAPGVKAFEPCAWPSAALHARFLPAELTRVASRARQLHARMGERITWLDQAMAQRPSLPPEAGLSRPSGEFRLSSIRPSLVSPRAADPTDKN